MKLDLIDSKLRAPQMLAGQVKRRDLLEALGSSRPRPVVLVSATTGYGKTTMLAQWASRSRRPFTWLSLDERDNDPIVLLSYLANALDRIAPLDPDLFDDLSAPGVTTETEVVLRLASSLERIERGFVLVIDDVHELESPRCIDILDALVGHVPKGSQIALCGRGQPSRHVGSLRAQGQVLELGPEELRMNFEEAGQLLAEAGAELSESDTEKLVERTEGWPAGLYLAALSIQRGGSPVGVAESFDGSNRYVADYLRSEVFSRLPDSELRLLMQTSALERFCAPLCDAILGTSDSAVLLDSLEASNLFVVPLDQSRTWFRYNRLFRESLLAELERTEPGAVGGLLARASDWCNEHGAAGDAIAYAQAANDLPRVGKLLLEHGQHEYQRGRAVTVERWLDWLEGHPDLERNGWIAAPGAWFSALRGNSDRTERLADIAAIALDYEESETARDEIEAWLALTRVIGGKGGLEAMSRDAEYAVETFPRASPWWLSGALMLAMTLFLKGEEEDADDLFARVVEAGGQAEAWNGTSVALAERASLAADRDDWVAAERLVVEAEAVMRRARMQAYPPNAIVLAVAARVALHRRESKRAHSLLAEVQMLRPQLTRALATISIQTRVVLAQAYIALADPAGARTQLREASGLLREGRSFGLLTDRIDDLQAQLEAIRIRTPGASTLTTAELRLLPMLPTHLSFPEIGERLFVSRHTVKSQAMSIYRKLDVTSRADAVERARELGLLH